MKLGGIFKAFEGGHLDEALFGNRLLRTRQEDRTHTRTGAARISVRDVCKRGGSDPAGVAAARAEARDTDAGL